MECCVYYNTVGGCRFGENCKFTHADPKKKLCLFYRSGKGCRYGNACFFAHELDQKSTVPSTEPQDMSPGLNNCQQVLCNVESKENFVQKEVACGECGDICCGNNVEKDLCEHYITNIGRKVDKHVRLFKSAEFESQTAFCPACGRIFKDIFALFPHMAEKAKHGKGAKHRHTFADVVAPFIDRDMRKTFYSDEFIINQISSTLLLSNDDRTSDNNDEYMNEKSM